MTDRLRPLWDFDDLTITGQRLRQRLEEETSDEGRAEVLTQLARVDGLRGNLEAGERLLEEAAGLPGTSAAASCRIDLERGRLLRSRGEPETALPLFSSAYETALRGSLWFLAADAAHMAALAAPEPDGFAEWTHRGLDLAEEHGDASYWAGPLLNNLGWKHFEAGALEPALEAFERALRARERDTENPAALAVARYAVGRTLRGIDRPAEAIPLLEQAIAWADDTGAPDGWFHEELAEEYAAIGRKDEAKAQAHLAIPLLEADDPSFTAHGERLARLRALGRDEAAPDRAGRADR